MEKISAHRELGKYKVIIGQLMNAIPVVSGLMQLEEEESKLRDMIHQISILKERRLLIQFRKS